MARLLCHFVGRPADMARFELHSVLAAEGIAFTESQWTPPFAVVEIDEVPAAAVLERLAFTHEVSRGTGVVRPHDLHAIAALPREGIPERATFAVRAERLTPGPLGGPRRADVERTLGAAWADDAHGVDLRDPDVTVRAYMVDDAVFVGLPLWTNQGGSYEERAAKHRPYFSPVSGHPRWMRAMVNCAGVARGGLLYDPVCGTGGTLIEAAAADLLVVGSDLDPAMVQGTKTNLAHYGLHAASMFVADVRAAPAVFADEAGIDHPDGIVADLPYGQSASTKGATPGEVAAWTLQTCVQMLLPGHRAVIGTSDPLTLEPVPHGLREIARFANRVHKAMTRHYVVFERLGG